MFRLAIFLLVVILLFRAGFHRVAEPSAPAPRAVASTLTSRIGGPPVARTEPAVPGLPGADLPQTPAPFLSAELREADPAQPAPAAEPEGASQHYTVIVLRLPLRAGPSRFYPELATLSRGDTVTATRLESAEWLWARTRSGALRGYVPAGSVTPAE